MERAAEILSSHRERVVQHASALRAETRKVERRQQGVERAEPARPACQTDELFWSWALRERPIHFG